MYLFLAVFWIAFALPIRMAFEDSSAIDGYIAVIDTISDLFFLGDMVLSLFIPIND